MPKILSTLKNLIKTDGTLYIVATPIGNQEDISRRAINVLSTVDTILAEDTRHSIQLLTNLGIHKPLLSLHSHNEREKTENIINELKNGKSFALISDAGTPLISDPGFLLVRYAREKKIPVIPIPGACAAITALSAAGIPCDVFTFAGFLPAKQQDRKNTIESFKKIEQTIIYYESTHRLLDCIDDINFIYGESYEWVLAKELTKTFEHFISGNSNTIKIWLLGESRRCKGEFVLILPQKKSENLNDCTQKILSILLKELPLKKAVEVAVLLTKRHKNDVYKLALSLQKSI